jgi:hypothetical protein
MKHLKKYKSFLEDGTAAATGTTAGMGAVASGQPGSTAGTTGAAGSGDISFYLNDKKSKKAKKGNPSEVSDMRFLEPAKGITKVKESAKTEEYFIVEECLTELIDMGFKANSIEFDSEDEEYDINDNEVGKFKSQQIRISLFKQVEKTWRGNLNLRYNFDRNEIYKKSISTLRPDGDKIEKYESEIAEISEEISHKLINYLEYTSGTLTISFQVDGACLPTKSNININIHIILDRNFYPTNESYNDIDEYVNEIKTMLKAYNIRPVVLNQIIDGYSNVIEEYYQEGKYPKLFVDEIIKDFELDSGGFLSYKVGSKSYNQTIKYL